MRRTAELLPGSSELLGLLGLLCLLSLLRLLRLLNALLLGLLSLTLLGLLLEVVDHLVGREDGSGKHDHCEEAEDQGENHAEAPRGRAEAELGFAADLPGADELRHEEREPRTRSDSEGGDPLLTELDGQPREDRHDEEATVHPGKHIEPDERVLLTERGERLEF